MTAALAEGLVEAPRLAAPAEARRRLASLIESASGAALEPELERGRTRDVLLGLADHSPYLWALVREDPERLVRLLQRPPGRIARRARSRARRTPRRERGGPDARAAPRQARIGASGRACRHRRRLGRRRGDRGADPLRRRRRPRGDRFPAAQPCARRTSGARSGSLRCRAGLRPRRAGARQAWRARAQLFERHRPHRALRPCGGVDSARNGAGAAVRTADPVAGAAPAGAHQRRLCAAGRSAPAARSRLDAGRAVDRRAPTSITRRSARTGSAPR